ncbi:MerR family transcriptional regulator [Flavobacterium sp. DG1-102-2]|uniref:MerR family transcriptional regulator n=1 Tax=Flavobacterium sp. DG1-102-2 TaxID=3081663 RepID=UPI00294A6B36|nr:MerR family transcriptional regulator [Flavobacterium sp. DG1-102-2]MDV6168032.1 MerR family transcriptional regulator [Flavobacterium sp. DG1-102-2]
MSNKIKNVFTIKDLENLSGIKAHTIRIWEKRYAILEPMRTDSNIRYYDAHNLQKLLNVSTLNSFGYKISAIAKMPEESIPALVKEVLSNKSMNNYVLNNFKLAMMNFDLPLFAATYNTLQAENTFRAIFYEYFLPLLEEIGMLWQTGTISPAHEHFISSLIKQKVAANSEKLQLLPPTKTDRVFALYLPENEIHEIGLMFINYELLLNGYRTIYIGESMPLHFVKDVKNYFDNITFVTYITSHPYAEEMNRYIKSAKEEILDDGESKLYIFGRNIQYIPAALLDDTIKVFESITGFADHLQLT